MIRVELNDVTEGFSENCYHGLFRTSSHNQLSRAEITGWLEENCKGAWKQKISDKMLLVIFGEEADYRAARAHFKAEYSAPSFGLAIENFLV